MNAAKHHTITLMYALLLATNHSNSKDSIKIVYSPQIVKATHCIFECKATQSAKIKPGETVRLTKSSKTPGILICCDHVTLDFEDLVLNSFGKMLFFFFFLSSPLTLNALKLSTLSLPF